MSSSDLLSNNNGEAGDSRMTKSAVNFTELKNVQFLKKRVEKT
jgi:hypothetical protein